MEYVDAKTIVTTNKAMNWNYLAAEYNMNIYRGCSHGCIYCFARGAYYRIEEFDRVRSKKDALRIIRDDLQRKIKRGVITTGGMSDPYNPREAEFLLTRHALELVNAFAFGICILTKSDLVTRDIDILKDIKTHSPAVVAFSITCGDDTLCKQIEPHVAATSERFAAIKQLSDNGIMAGVLLDPVIPYLTDNEENVRCIVRQAKASGAQFIYFSPRVTMEGIQRDHFFEKAKALLPDVEKRYTQKFKGYYYCRSPHSKKLGRVFIEECEKQKIIYDMRAANHLIRFGYDLNPVQLTF